MQASRTQSLEQRFGPQPPSYFDTFSPVAILGAQFVLTLLILVTIRPPFICGSQGAINVRTVFGIGVITTVICVIAHRADVSDIVRGTLHTMKTCMMQV